MAGVSVSTVLRKRWYVALAGLLLTACLAAYAAVAVAPKYQAEGRTLLLPPAQPAGSNPFLSLGGLSGLTDVVASRMTDAVASQTVVTNGGTGSYTVVRDGTTSAPILLVTAQGKTAAEAIRTMDVVDALVSPTLQTMQTRVNVPTNALVTTTTVAIAKQATIVRKSQLRAVIGAAALGLILTVLFTGWLDRMLRQRRIRKPRSPRPVDDSADLDEEFGAVTVAAESAESSTMDDADLGATVTLPERGSDALDSVGSRRTDSQLIPHGR